MGFVFAWDIVFVCLNLAGIGVLFYGLWITWALEVETMKGTHEESLKELTSKIEVPTNTNYGLEMEVRKKDEIISRTKDELAAYKEKYKILDDQLKTFSCGGVQFAQKHATPRMPSNPTSQQSSNKAYEEEERLMGN